METNDTEQSSGLRRFATFVIMLLSLMALAVMFGWMPLLPTAGPESDPAVGRVMPAVDLVPLTGGGESVSLDSLRGKVALLNFWATWCPPCLHELPDVAALHRQYADDPGVRILAVSCDSTGRENLPALSSSTAATIGQMELDLPTYADPLGRTRAAYDQVAGFRGYPTSVLLDGRGTIQAVWVGATGREQFETAIERVRRER